MTQGPPNVQAGEVALPSTDFAADLTFYTEVLGLRLDTSFPADDPLPQIEPRRQVVPFSLPPSRITAVASISTCALDSIRPRTTTTDMAGKCRPIISR